MSVSRGDETAAVRINRQRFLTGLDLHESALAVPNQVSRDRVQEAIEPGQYPGTDALFARDRGPVLSVLTADCSPILFWSDDRPVWGAVHSGWQGSELDILGKTLSRVAERTGASMKSLNLVIGPGLSEPFFEVGPEFKRKFSSQYLRPKPNSEKFYFDNNAFLRDTAIQHGVPSEQIEILPYCSYADETLFFSHRRDKGKTGRMISVIGMRK